MQIGEPIENIRKYLHQHPELSREESQTSDFVASFFKDLEGYTITRNVGHHGLIATRKFGEGASIAFRAELDALPILEKSNGDFVSKNKGVSHACGHDGHICILLDLARKLDQNPPKSGTVHFLFQSAEETGEGALAMVESDVFSNVTIDCCYALHNIPGKPLGTILSKNGSFACASVGFSANIEGKTAHAAHPENAINPLEIAIELLSEVKKLPKNPTVNDFALTTSIALNSGDKAFGTSPASAELMVTMRAALTDDLDFMMDQTKVISKKIAEKSGSKIELDFEEYFPATMNPERVDQLKAACKKADIAFQKMENPFPWSEDFSQFSKVFPILMFGLGSGSHQPSLHAPNFNFPDSLIETGSEVFYQLFLSHLPK